MTRVPLHLKILGGLAAGAVAGGAANVLWRDAPWLVWAVENLAQPAGQIFLRLLFMVVVPLVFTSLVLGVTGLGDVSRLGRLGLRTFGLFLATTVAAATLGLVLVNVVGPGEAIDAEVRAGLMEQFEGQAAERVAAAEQTSFGIQTLVAIVPRNPIDSAARGDMLGLIFFSVIFGVALASLGWERARPLLDAVDSIAGAVPGVEGLARQGAHRDMTTSAWMMLAVTWAVIGFFTLKFFLAVLRTPPRDRD